MPIRARRNPRKDDGADRGVLFGASEVSRLPAMDGAYDRDAMRRRHS